MNRPAFLLAATTLALAAEPASAQSNPVAGAGQAPPTVAVTTSNSAVLTGYSDRPSWLTAVGGPTTLLDFENIPDGTLITNQLASQGIASVSGSSPNAPGPVSQYVTASTSLPFPMFVVGTLPSETNFIANILSPPTYATGEITFDMVTPATAIGAYFADQAPLGQAVIEVFDANGASLGSVALPDATLPNSFRGAVSTVPFSSARFSSASSVDSWGLDDLEHDGGSGPGNIGQNYCGPAVANSSGMSGVISATGTTTAASNDVTLAADQLPLNQFGYFLNSQTQAFVFPVPNSQGALCLGGQIGRYNAQVLNSGNTGSFALALDLPTTPTPTGTTAIVAGQTWNFTCWYRDTNPGSTSNFTDGLNIAFQ